MSSRNINNDDPLPTSFPQPEWATDIPGRTPRRKIYEKRGHAMSSLRYRDDSFRPNGKTWYERGCKLYQLVDGAWTDVTEEFKSS